MVEDEGKPRFVPPAEQELAEEAKERAAGAGKRGGGPPRRGGGMTRRSLLRHSLLVALGVGAAGAGYIPLRSEGQPLLRPPGAVPEHDFLSSCIKCGQCVQVCPVKAIELAPLERGFGIGTAHVVARDQACDFSCDALQCILACPTGALSHELSKPEQVRMGLAVLTRPDTCLARRNQGFKGHPRGPNYAGLLRYAELDRWNPKPVREHPYDRPVCDLCVVACPIKGAIRLVQRQDAEGRTYHEPEVQKGCTGCGVCEMICPSEPASIEIVPWRQWAALA